MFICYYHYPCCYYYIVHITWFGQTEQVLVVSICQQHGVGFRSFPKTCSESHHMSSEQNYVKSNAMHKLGSSPIGYEGFVQPRTCQGEARLNQ